MDALTAANAALRYVIKDHPAPLVVNIQRAEWALEKIEKAFEAVNGTEERPGT